MSLFISNKLVIDKCIIFWEKARVPHKSSQNFIKKAKKSQNMLDVDFEEPCSGSSEV